MRSDNRTNKVTRNGSFAKCRGNASAAEMQESAQLSCQGVQRNGVPLAGLNKPCSRPIQRGQNVLFELAVSGSHVLEIVVHVGFTFECVFEGVDHVLAYFQIEFKGFLQGCVHLRRIDF